MTGNDEGSARSLYRLQGFLAAALLLAAILTGGCAAMNNGGSTSAEDGRPLQEPGVETEAPEPTVIEPTVVAYPEYRDPLIGLNRAVFAFNDIAYRYLLIPASRQYLRRVPEPVRRSVNNFFSNLKTPIYLINYMLQLRAAPMVRSIQRFGINSTVGVLGLFDPAAGWYGLQPAATGFEETLIQYGAGYGVVSGAAPVRAFRRAQRCFPGGGPAPEPGSLPG